MNNDSDHLHRRGKACVLATGCPENRIDAARIQEFLRGEGWEMIDDYRHADLIVLNACGFTQDNETSSLENIREIRAGMQPSAELLVGGCLSVIDPEKLRAAQHEAAFESDRIESLAQIVHASTDPASVQANYLLARTDELAPKRRKLPCLANLLKPRAVARRLTEPYRRKLSRAINVFDPKTFCIKISTGCLNACSFCAIRLARGRIRSRAIDEILCELKKGRAEGFTRFALLGTDLGAYGRDHGTTLAALLEQMTNEKGDFEIRLRNIQPRFLIEMMAELRPVFRSGKVTYLSSAAESGSNRILNLMRRGYTIEDYKQAIGILNREFPHIRIRTQLMVGFPGETEAEFRDTYRLLDELRFDFAEVYRFQPRPNTAAAEMPDIVSPAVACRRFYKLLLKATFNQSARKQSALRAYKAWMRDDAAGRSPSVARTSS